MKLSLSFLKQRKLSLRPCKGCRQQQQLRSKSPQESFYSSNVRRASTANMCGSFSKGMETPLLLGFSSVSHDFSLLHLLLSLPNQAACFLNGSFPWNTTVSLTFLSFYLNVSTVNCQSRVRRKLFHLLLFSFVFDPLQWLHMSY